MAITSPVALPGSAVARTMRWTQQSKVAVQPSMFTAEQTVYAHQGEWWEVEVELPPMAREDAAPWQGFFGALNGPEHTFLMGDPVGASPQGSWLSGSPSFSLNGAHAAGVKTLTAKDFASGATGKAGDWIQIGSGLSAHLHQLVQDFTAAANGSASLEIWPRTRAAYSSGQLLVVNSPVGLWRLASSMRGWSLAEAAMYGFSFQAIEAL